MATNEPLPGRCPGTGTPREPGRVFHQLCPVCGRSADLSGLTGGIAPHAARPKPELVVTLTDEGGEVWIGAFTDWLAKQDWVSREYAAEIERDLREDGVHYIRTSHAPGWVLHVMEVRS